MSDQRENKNSEKSLVSSKQSPVGQPCERQTASAAYRQFQFGNFTESIKLLKELQSSRPQDSKIRHNLCLAEFYESQGTKTYYLYDNLLSISEQLKIKLDDENSLDDVDQCVVLYNRAVILFHLHKYKGAIELLNKVFPYIEQLDENLGKKSCLLLLELFLYTNQAKKALEIFGYFETTLLPNIANKTNRVSDKDYEKDMDELKMKLTLARSRYYTLTKETKLWKREVRNLMTSTSPRHHMVGLFLKAQMEFLKGNHYKALKILNSNNWPIDDVANHLETGECLQALYYNNVSCIFYYIAKPSLSTSYIKKACDVLEEQKQSFRKNIYKGSDTKITAPLHTIRFDLKNSLQYNLGMVQFQAGYYAEAFSNLTKMVDLYPENPRLWLRIAECCIQYNRMNGGKPITHQRTSYDVIGFGDHKRVVLCPDKYKDPNLTEMSGNPSLSFNYAIWCLKNSLLLLSPSKESSIKAPPCIDIPSSEIPNLRNSVIIAASYTSLRLGDYITAHEYAGQILNQQQVSGAHSYLAHMYAGEALVYLDKISEAVQHFNPEEVCDITYEKIPYFYEVSGPNSQINSGQPKLSPSDPDFNLTVDSFYYPKVFQVWLPDTIEMARLITKFNLAVAYAMRGEWGKALNLALDLIEDNQAPAEVKPLLVYIYLCQGDTEAAKSCLNKHISTKHFIRQHCLSKKQ